MIPGRGVSHANVLRLNGHAVMYTVPGRSIMVSPERVVMIFTGGPLGPERFDAHAMRRMLRGTYRNAGWSTGALLEALDSADDVYVDQIASIAVDRYAIGHAVLIGDAAWGGTLGGQGAPLAIVGAYVFAGELTKAHGDIATALARYEFLMRPCDAVPEGRRAGGSVLAPRTRLGLLPDLFIAR